MTVTYCDVTGKVVPRATTNYTWETRANRYETLLTKDLSPDGKEKLDAATQRMMSNKNVFAFMDYKATRKTALERVTSRR